MYLPPHFEEMRPGVLHELVFTHPLGLLVTQSGAGLQANNVPFVLDPDPAGGPGILRGHVARANPVWRETREGCEALIVFQGPQAYISPSYYPSKAEHGKVVPTWNYVMVQARGTLRATEDAQWLRAFVSRLTQRHESTRAAPWSVSDAPDEYIASMLRAIVGIEMTLTALTGKWKISQNRSAVDRAGIAHGLREPAAPGDAAQAAAMASLVENTLRN